MPVAANTNKSVQYAESESLLFKVCPCDQYFGGYEYED